ncbi:MAG: TetR/AcrR family transcriptional regulator [Glaciecola sp.]
MNNNKKSRSQQKREDILKAAMQVFREKGVQATSMDQLAETAKVSKRTVYNHFDSKETLVMSLLHELWEQFMLRASVEYVPDTPIAEQLGALIDLEINMMCDEDFFTVARLAIGHCFYSTEKMRMQMERIRGQETALQRWLRAACADGKFHIDDIDFAADQIGNLLKGILFWPVLLCDDPAPTAETRLQAKEQTVMMFMSRYASEQV